MISDIAKSYLPYHMNISFLNDLHLTPIFILGISDDGPFIKACQTLFAREKQEDLKTFIKDLYSPRRGSRF